MKILLMGDASNYHSTLGAALAGAGHDVTVASHGSRWMRTARDIDLSRREGRLGGALLWLRLNTVLASRLKGYDVVQISNPVFLDLRPGRVKTVFDRLRRDNGGVFLTALGTDTAYVEMCLSASSPLRYSDYSLVQPAAHAALWTSSPLSDHCRYVYDNIDGAVTALYEYHLACSRALPADKLAYGGIPVECDNPCDLNEGKGERYTRGSVHEHPLRVLVACHKGREHEKGVDVMLPYLHEAVEQSRGTMLLDMVQDVPFSEFSQRLQQADVVVDQLYSYTPATSALMAMARGKVAVSGGEEDFYRFIGEDDMRPIINPDPFSPGTFADSLLQLSSSPLRLAQLSAQSAAFVRKHNAAPVVASRFLDFWNKTIR